MARILATIILFLGICDLSHAIETLAVPGGNFEINWKSKFSDKEKEKLRVWLGQAAYTASLVAGRFPLTETRININRNTRGNSAVPFAHTIRNTTPEGVEFHVNPRKSLKSLVRDWTAVHEFSHLYIPYPGKRDIWISEGFASYYQNILMARGKVLSEKETWQKLADGFQRGTQDQNNNIKLKALNRRKSGSRMRIYWSGALYFLEVDLNLRIYGQSLDQVINDYVACCRSGRKYTNGKTLIRDFDNVAGREVFTPLYEKYANKTSLPDYKRVLARLGIILDQDHKVLLKMDEYHAALRKTFINPVMQTASTTAN